MPVAHMQARQGLSGSAVWRPREAAAPQSGGAGGICEKPVCNHSKDGLTLWNCCVRPAASSTPNIFDSDATLRPAGRQQL